MSIDDKRDIGDPKITPADFKLVKSFREEDFEGFKAALQDKANPNVEEGDQLPIAMGVAIAGKPEYLDLLIEFAKTNECRLKGIDKALIFVASVGKDVSHVEVAKLLIKAGADLWITDQDDGERRTVLDQAVIRANLVMIEGFRKIGIPCSETSEAIIKSGLFRRGKDGQSRDW